MIRGTFANIRLRNKLVPGSEGSVTMHLPDGEVMSIFDASVKYIAEGTPLIVMAGAEYGTGSSRDWAAKGTILLGVKAVIAKSFERIHRSNLVMMGVLPLQFKEGEDAAVARLDRARNLRHPRHRRRPDSQAGCQWWSRLPPMARKTTFTVDGAPRYARSRCITIATAASCRPSCASS